jgi:hypothetical protein
MIVSTVYEHISRIGLDPKYTKDWIAKWKTLRDNCSAVSNNGREAKRCYLTVFDYINLAKDASIHYPSKIGRKLGQYQMGRLGDAGDYILGNCRFITKEQNLLERIENRVFDEYAKVARTRNKHNHDGVRRSSDMRRMMGNTSFGVREAAAIRLGQTKYDTPGLLSMSETKIKFFRVVSPFGDEYIDKNLTEFCKCHSIGSGNMSEVCAGKAKHHKGWTGNYITKGEYDKLKIN